MASAVALLDLELFQRCSAAVQDGLRYVERLRTNSPGIRAHRDWFDLEWRENGMPRFNRTFGDVPLDYKEAIDPPFRGLGLFNDQPPEPNFEEEPSFLSLLEYIRSNQRLTHHFIADDRFFTVGVKIAVGALLDKYVHTYQTTDFSADHLLPLYAPLERFWYSDNLEVNILVPILFLRFKDTNYELANGISLVELSPTDQLARAPRERYGHHPLVQGAATHAFALSNYTIPNESWYHVEVFASNPQVYPTSVIDLLFGALRVVTEYPTGYAQLLLQPVGWVSNYDAQLSRFNDATVRKYQLSFEDADWDAPVPMVTSGDLEHVGSVFRSALTLTQDKKHTNLALAFSRLNSGLLRATDEDGIVDVAIGLEALLSTDNQEMTHKVALRMAALARLGGHHDPLSIFTEAKRVYAYRSAVVHGTAKDLAKKRTIERAGVKLPSTQVAIEHLRLALRVLLDHPDYLDVDCIDAELLIR